MRTLLNYPVVGCIGVIISLPIGIAILFSVIFLNHIIFREFGPLGCPLVIFIVVTIAGYIHAFRNLKK